MKLETQLIDIKLLEGNKGQIKGLPKNPRIIKDDRFNKLVKSMRDSPEFIYLRELIVFPYEGKYVVIAGNQRLAGLNELKEKQAPCKVLSADTPIEKLKEYTIKDNVAFGEMDWGVVYSDWDIDEVGEWGENIKEWELTPINYSTKNTEIDINKIEGTHTIKITLSKEDWDKIKTKVQQSNKTNEEIFFSAAIQL